MTVMCIMTFVIMMATICLTAVDAAHKNVVHRNEVQQAYYTAKSAAEKTAAYIQGHMPNETAADGTMEKELFDIYTAYKNALDAGTDTSSFYIKGEDSGDTAIGSYTVDIYPTSNPQVFKVVANSKYHNNDGSLAILVGPSGGGTGLEDAIVSTEGGDVNIGGSAHMMGSISVDKNNFEISSIYFGGSVCNAGGNIIINSENGMHQDYFTSSISKGSVFRIDATGNIEINKGRCSYTNNSIFGENNSADETICTYDYYSYIVSDGDITLKGFGASYGTPNLFSRATNTTDHTIFCKGKFKTESCKSFTIDGNLYSGSEANIGGDGSGGTLTVTGNMFVNGNLTLSGLNLNVEGNLYVSGTINKNGNSLTTAQTYNVTSDEIENNAASVIAVYNKEMLYAKNSQQYKDWTFTTEQLEAMEGSSAKQWAPKANNRNGSSSYYCTDEIVNSSGKLTLNTTNINVGSNEYGGIVFDTNVYSTTTPYPSGNFTIDQVATPTGDYQDLYLELTSSVSGLGKPSIEVWGRGNVYIYLPNNIKWKVSEISIYCKDYPTESHVYFISNDSASKIDYDSNNIICFSSLNGTKTRQGTELRPGTTDYFYIYCPNGNVEIGGSSGIAGAVIAKYPNLTSGSNLPNLFVPPVDSKGNSIGINGITASSGLTNLLYTRK